LIQRLFIQTGKSFAPIDRFDSEKTSQNLGRTGTTRGAQHIVFHSSIPACRRAIFIACGFDAAIAQTDFGGPRNQR